MEAVLNRQSSRELERKLAARSMVLLRNENHTLPLARSLKKVALIGPLADSVEDIEGGWTVEGLFGGKPKSHVVTVAEGLKNKLGPDMQITVVNGPGLRRDFPSMIDDLLGKKQNPVPTPAEVEESVRQAVDAANQADLVIAVMGEAANMSGEGASRATLDLPGNQEQMLEAVVATGKPVVLVLDERQTARYPLGRGACAGDSGSVVPGHGGWRCRRRRPLRRCESWRQAASELAAHRGSGTDLLQPQPDA